PRGTEHSRAHAGLLALLLDLELGKADLVPHQGPHVTGEPADELSDRLVFPVAGIEGATHPHSLHDCPGQCAGTPRGRVLTRRSALPGPPPVVAAQLLGPLLPHRDLGGAEPGVGPPRLVRRLPAQFAPALQATLVQLAVLDRG